MDMMEQLNAFWPIILMVVIFYFMLWRPQKKQQKQRQEMLNSLKAGVKIITAGGIYGTIVSLHDEYLVIRVADKVEIKITRNAVNQVLGKQEPAPRHFWAGRFMAFLHGPAKAGPWGSMTKQTAERRRL